MARVTVEDCLEQVDNRFDLVLIASKRARQLMTGAEQAFVEIDNDKPTVVALREIAECYVDEKIHRGEIIGHEKAAAESTAVLPEQVQDVEEGGESGGMMDQKPKGFTTSGFSSIDEKLRKPPIL